MHYIQGKSRQQTTLLPETLDDYVREDNPVRFLDAFVEELNLKELGFEHAVLSHTGRPPFHPGILIKLYVYGCLNQVRSSRRLESECHRNVEVMWLLQRLAPDHKTISEFRRRNLSGLRGVCREFLLLCKKLDLFGKELIAIDGSKFEAVNSNRRNYTAKKLKQLIARIEAYIDKYLKELDETDESEKDDRGMSVEELKAQIDALKSNKADYEDLLSSLESSGETQVSSTDPDSRLMRDGHQGKDVCFNAQIAVDDKHHLIVCDDVSNACNDQKELASLATAAKEILQVEELAVAADCGYHDSENIKACIDAAITPYVPRPRKYPNHVKGLFSKEDFAYDAASDSYRCPAGQILPFRFTYQKHNRQMRAYENSRVCTGCRLRSQCMAKKKGHRRISRWEHEHLLEEMQQRLKAHPQMMHKRRNLAEHPFGSLKRWMGQRYFLLRGLDKVKTEFSMMVLGYNLRRVINILGTKRLLEALA